MKAKTFDPSKLDDAINVLESMRQHRIQHPVDKSDELYYELLGRYYRNIRYAHETGKKLVYHTPDVPVEILQAMDLVPGVCQVVSIAIASLSNSWEENLAAARAYGLGSEICSMHRVETGVALNGFLPAPDAMIGCNMPCDNTAKSSDVLRGIWGCPTYFLDRSYGFDSHDLAHFTSELRDLVTFLEDVIGQKMDYDRLVQAVQYGRELMIAQRELEEMRKARPMPTRSRTNLFAHVIDLCQAGLPEAVVYFEHLLTETKARRERGESFVKEERYRLLEYFEPPAYGWKTIDWMERSHGAVIAFEPLFGQWQSGDYEPARPLEALAYKTFIRPTRQFQGPCDAMIEDMVRGAKEYDVDGVITFSSVGCFQACAMNRAIKDAIAEETGLPFLSIEVDFGDPSFTTEEEMRDKLESFFEMIDERRG